MEEFKINIEKIYLVVFVLVMMWVGFALYDNSLRHDYPHGDFASDAFQHLPKTDWVKEEGSYKFNPFYGSTGYHDVVGFYPPGLYYISAAFSIASGLEVYDVIFFVTIIITIISCLFIYVIIREYNTNVALLSLPLMLLVFIDPFFIGIRFGSRPFFITNLFVIGVLWFFSRIELKKSWIFFGIFWGVTMIAHGIEYFYIVGIVGAFVAIKFIYHRLKLKDIKNIIIGGAVGVVLPIYYSIIFVLLYVVGDIQQGSNGGTGFFPNGFLRFVGVGNPIYNNVTYSTIFQQFKLISIIVIIGMVVSGIILVKKLIDKKGIDYALLFGFFGFMMGSFNFIGFRKAFQSRFFFPIFLAVFFGIAVYYLIILVKSLAKIKWKTMYSVIISLVLLLSIIYAYYDKPSQFSAIDPYHWEAITWISDNTPIDSKVYFFYGDIYDQDAILRNSHRFHFFINWQDQEYQRAVQNGTVLPYYNTERPGDSLPGYPYRKGLFEFGRHEWEYNEEFGDMSLKFSSMDICSFDYYVFDIHPDASRTPAFIQYNNLVRAVFLTNGMSEVFNNQVVSIVKNNKIDDCSNMAKFMEMIQAQQVAAEGGEVTATEGEGTIIGEGEENT
ncbi:MAG: hypothetical protein ABII01_07025 [Candidatus Woesearchaeota archaeon]